MGSILFKTKLNNTTATDVMVINGFSGNIGIGTTVPKAKINIANPSGTVGALSDSSLFLLFNNATAQSAVGFNHGKIGWTGYNRTVLSAYIESGIDAGTFDDHGYIAFGNSNASATATVERMRIAQDGSVLIGVTGAYNSSRLLQVKDGLLIGNSFYTFASIDTSGTADLILTSNANPANLGSNSNIIFKLGTSAGGGPEERMRIVSNGNVGIGTTNPSSSLHVYGTTPTIKVQGSSTASAKVELIGTYTTWSLENQYINGANNDMFRIYNSALSADAITINRATNNVGIGATNPTAKLHIQSGSILVKGATTPGLNLEPSGVVGNADISFDGASFILVSNSNSSDLRLSTNSTPRLTILANGNVGIGFTAPAANLHVFGPTMIVGDSNTTQNVRQTIVGSTTGNASTTAKKIFVCGHTSTGTITVTAIITSVDTASATATFSFANAYGNSVTPNRLSYISLNSTITSIDCSYNNSGYQMEISVTYTGATAPTLYFTAEGMGSSIWTLY
jgi:hypothetical protein